MVTAKTVMLVNNPVVDDKRTHMRGVINPNDISIDGMLNSDSA